MIIKMIIIINKRILLKKITNNSHNNNKNLMILDNFINFNLLILILPKVNCLSIIIKNFIGIMNNQSN